MIDQKSDVTQLVSRFRTSPHESARGRTSQQAKNIFIHRFMQQL
jgi:hypothetical protein